MRAISGTLGAVLLFTPALSLAQSSTAATKAEIQKLFDARNGARNRGDWSGYAEGFTADATTVSSAGIRVVGRAAIQKDTESMWGAGVYKGSQTKQTVESVQEVSPGVLLVDSTFEITNIPGGGARKGWTTFVFVREGDQWKAAASRSMVPTPAGALKPAR